MAGLERRYAVKKINDPEGKHGDCWYFVLDPKHDPHAREAMRAYAKSVADEHPQLAFELLVQVSIAEEDEAES